MVMNLFILLLVSLPEAFLNLIMALLITGRKENLKINKQNVIRFLTALFFMLLSSYCIRPISPNIITSVAAHVIAYSLIIMFVYRMKLIYALFGTAFFYLVIAITESLYTPYVITYGFKGMANFQNAYHWYVLLSLPQRVVQIIVIALLWKHEVLLITMINRQFHKVFLASFLLLTLGEYLLCYIFVAVFDMIPFVYQITLSVSLFIIAIVLNVMIFKLMYMVISHLIVKSYSKYNDLEDDVKFAFNEIRTLLLNNQVDEAVKLIDNLNGVD